MRPRAGAIIGRTCLWGEPAPLTPILPVPTDGAYRHCLCLFSSGYYRCVLCSACGRRAAAGRDPSYSFGPRIARSNTDIVAACVTGRAGRGGPGSRAGSGGGRTTSSRVTRHRRLGALRAASRVFSRAVRGCLGADLNVYSPADESPAAAIGAEPSEAAPRRPVEVAWSSRRRAERL